MWFCRFQEAKIGVREGWSKIGKWERKISVRIPYMIYIDSEGFRVGCVGGYFGEAEEGGAGSKNIEKVLEKSGFAGSREQKY